MSRNHRQGLGFHFACDFLADLLQFRVRRVRRVVNDIPCPGGVGFNP